MDCVFGLAGNGFAVVVADTSAGDGILLHKKDDDKIMVLDSHKLIAASGERGDRVQFTEYVQKNVSLYQFRNGIPLTTAAAAHFTRGVLATALRENPYSVNILMAGYDKEAGASLYCIDFLGALHKVDKGAFGYGSYFSLSTMDRHYRSDMSLVEALHLVDECIDEIKSRLVTAPPNFVVKIVDKHGARHFYSTDSTSRMVFPTKTFQTAPKIFQRFEETEEKTKTELCNKWQETGTCPYGDQCQFAHGVMELHQVKTNPELLKKWQGTLPDVDPCQLALAIMELPLTEEKTKTELCNKWQETGTCPYGDQCQFAHGIKELRPVIHFPRDKTEVCRMVLAGNSCPYGHRCHFRHSVSEQEKANHSVSEQEKAKLVAAGFKPKSSLNDPKV